MLSNQEVNEGLQLYASGTEPEQPYTGQVWLDTSVTSYLLKQYADSGWETIVDIDPYTLLEKLKTVDGHGNGLDADLLDGLKSVQFVRCDVGTHMSAHTIWKNNKQARFADNSDLKVQHSGNNAWIDNNTGSFWLRCLQNSGKFLVELKDAAGNSRRMLHLDSDVPKLWTHAALVSQADVKTVQNNEVYETKIPRNSVGHVYIFNMTGGEMNCAIFAMGLDLSNNNGVIKIGGSDLYYSASKNSGKINVYAESTGNLKIQNISGFCRCPDNTGSGRKKRYLERERVGGYRLRS